MTLKECEMQTIFNKYAKILFSNNMKQKKKMKKEEEEGIRIKKECEKNTIFISCIETTDSLPSIRDNVSQPLYCVAFAIAVCGAVVVCLTVGCENVVFFVYDAFMTNVKIKYFFYYSMNEIERQTRFEQKQKRRKY